MPSIITYFGIMFGIMLAMYFYGYQSPFLAVVSSVGWDAPFTDIANMLINAVLNPSFLIPVLTSATITSLAIGDRDFYTFLIPVLAIFILFNLFVFPISFIYEAGFPTEYAMIINTTLNVFLVLGAISYARGM